MPSSKPYPTIEICSRCLQNTAFTQDPAEDDDWLSVCCWAPPVAEIEYESDDYTLPEQKDA